MYLVSLIAAFLAGLAALFAPCCITFLLPAYLGSVFKERRKVLAMTLIFGLGIFVVLMPAVIGVSFLAKTLFRYHDAIYYLGGVVMIGAGILAFLGIKLPMPTFSRQQEAAERTDALSIFTLGIFSGLTSSCCAPVLAGVLALTVTAPSFWTGIGLGAMYVVGMVTPLLISGYFLDAQKIFSKAVFSRKVKGVAISNWLAAGIFIPMGIVILMLTITGRISMENSSHSAQKIQDAAYNIELRLREAVGQGTTGEK